LHAFTPQYSSSSAENLPPKPFETQTGGIVVPKVLLELIPTLELLEPLELLELPHKERQKSLKSPLNA
jgi:hypothetical protein